MLLIHSSTDPHNTYSHYLAEILRGEGFVDYDEADLTDLDRTDLSRHDLLLLSRLTPTLAQTEMLTDYVAEGGRLIAFLPDRHLVSRLGMTPTFRGIDNGYLHVDPAQPILQGLCPEPVQVIVPAVGWAPATEATVTVMARIRETKELATSEEIPGIVWSRVGWGDAVLFSYDLPHAIARLRQGNPAHADLCFAGLDGTCRPSELFVGQLDPEQAFLPQADIQTALLARLIEMLAPRPRLWYYPLAEQRSAMVMTSDDDWSTLEQFEALLQGLRKRHAHCTFYIVPGTRVTKTLMDAWEREGHTFSVHPDLKSEDPQALFVPAMLRDNIARHGQEFDRSPRTIRHHSVRWLGYVDAARLLAELGIRMDVNYLSVTPFPLGYMAGSGRPLRFVDTDGTIIPCFQQPTLWTEECLIHPSFVFSMKWTVERALAETGKIVRSAAREFYTPVTINSHPVSFATYSSPLVEGAWDTALTEGIPIISADEWLTWTEGRESIRIEGDAGGYTLYSPCVLPEVTVLYYGECSPQTEGFSVSRQHLWGREYVAITLRDIEAGERRLIPFGSSTNTK
jgi:hypothetical protein